MRAEEHGRLRDATVAASPLTGWLGPIGRAWWLGDEPERRPRIGDGSRTEPDEACRGPRPRAVRRTVFDDLPHRRPLGVAVRG
jgi:hypothetical protein